MKFLAFFLLFGIANSSQHFENEVFERTTSYIQDYKLNRAVPDVNKYIPDEAKILIQYAKKYFNEKKMLSRPPKVISA